MPLFRKKPVVIEAINWNGNNLFEVYSFMYSNPDLSSSIAQDKWEDYKNIIKKEGLIIKSLEGEHIAAIGDWIIKGVEGEFYYCKPDIFKKTYEPA